MSRRLGSAGKPASQFWQCEQRSGVRGCPQGKRRGGGAGTPAKCPPPGRPRLTTSQNKRRGSTGERRSVPGFRAGGEQGTQQGTHEERQRKPHEPGRRASSHPPPGGDGTAPAARRDREEVAGPPRPGGASTHPPPGGGGPAPAARRDREEGAGPPLPGGASTHPPPGGGGTAPAARRDREEGGRSAAAERCFNHPRPGRGPQPSPRPAAAGGTTPAPLTLPGRRGRWRGNARPGRAAG